MMTALFVPPSSWFQWAIQMDSAGGTGVLLAFEPGEYHERPETSETRPADSLAASHHNRRQRASAHEGEAGAEGRRSVKRLCWCRPEDWDAIRLGRGGNGHEAFGRHTENVSFFASNRLTVPVRAMNVAVCSPLHNPVKAEFL